MQIEELIENIEQVPQVVKVKLNAIRELDLEIEDKMVAAKKKEEELFANIANMNPKEKNSRHRSIQMDYKKIQEACDEKFTITGELIDMMKDCQEIITENLKSTKARLDTKNPDIAKEIEKLFEEAEKSYASKPRGNDGRIVSSKKNEVSQKATSSSSSLPSSVSTGSSALTSQSSTSSSISGSSSDPPVSKGSTTCNLDSSRGGSDALPTEALTVTLQNEQSVRVNPETENAGGMQLTEITAELAEIATRALDNPRQKSKKCQKQQVLQHQQQSVAAVAADGAAPSTSRAGTSEASTSTTVEAAQAINPGNLDTARTYDTGEERYCFCNQIAYGDMVSCDNPDCPIEWFHYPCVNMTTVPEGIWYCAQCASAMKRQKNRK